MSLSSGAKLNQGTSFDTTAGRSTDAMACTSFETRADRSADGEPSAGFGTIAARDVSSEANSKD